MRVKSEINTFRPPTVPDYAGNIILSFCRLFRLEIVDASSSGSTESEQTQKTKVKGVVPRWQLWVLSECCPT
jgi:hypothetical protein